jgi:hypothetical protein
VQRGISYRFRMREGCVKALHFANAVAGFLLAPAPLGRAVAGGAPAGCEGSGAGPPAGFTASRGNRLQREAQVRCPICYEGVMLESITGSYCSRRYAHTDPCGFEAGLCSSTAEWDAAVERYRATLTLESTAHGLARLSPSPAATSPASPPAPTSPDGAGASCEPVAACDA